MNDPIAVAEILERAADLIVIDGWMQHCWGSPGGPRCADGHLQGAVNERLGEQRTPAAFLTVYVDALRLLEPMADHTLVGWNDAFGRTAGEVRDLFLTAAKTIRNETRDG